MQQNLGAVLDGARLVRYDPLHEVVYAWFGGNGIHVFESTGITVDYWTAGNCKKDAMEFHEAAASIDRHIKESYGNE